MKNSFVGFAVTTMLLFAVDTRSQVRQVKLNSAADMRGAYTMLKQVADTGTGEFTLNNQQLKIFTGKYVMYAHRRSETDSMADFGIGTYIVENGKVIEKMFFTTAGQENNTFELAINKSNDGYSQIIQFPPNAQGIRWVLTEDYAKAGSNLKSPLDGAWNMIKVVFVDKNGKANTYESSDTLKQFKLYESGYFMWANYHKSKQSGKTTTSYGYGQMAINEPGKITETNTSSTFAHALIGKPVTLFIKRIGNDQYEQTIIQEDGSKQIELYERLK